MSQLINNEQKMIEIIFANRNKEYGAYAIRSDYGNTVFKSVSLMIITITTIMSVAFYLTNKDQKGPDLAGQVFIHDSIYVIPFGEEKLEEKTEAAETKKEKQAPLEKPTTIVSESVTVNDTVYTEKPSTFTNSIVSDNTSTLSTGVGTGSAVSQNTLVGLKTGTGIKSSFEIDSEPEFEGGLNALYAFVRTNLKYPSRASEEGKDGTVYVKFVVDENGKVGSLSLLNNLGYGLDDEALRVVGIIPKFKSPAKIKGEAVKVYYQLPIRFKIK